MNQIVLDLLDTKVISHWYLMRLIIINQRIKSTLTDARLGAVATILLLIAVIAQLARPGVPMNNAAGLSPAAAFPSPIWTDVFLPALLYLP